MPSTPSGLSASRAQAELKVEALSPACDLYPLDAFYERAGQPLPRTWALDGPEMPEPYRSLLVHQRDMTPTLEAFHQERVHLRVLARELHGDEMWREVVLTTDEGGVAVEFGAIVIHCHRFPEAARQDVLGCRTPLGTILAVHEIAHVSRPTAYFAVEADSVISKAFGTDQASGLHYGRCNALLDVHGEPLANVVEVLPLLG